MNNNEILKEKAQEYVVLKKQSDEIEKKLKELKDFILYNADTNEILVEEMQSKLQIRESSSTEYNVKKIYDEMEQSKLKNFFFNIVKVSKSAVSSLPVDEAKRKHIESILLKNSVSMPGSKSIYILKLKG